MMRNAAARVTGAGLTTGIVDGLFSSILAAGFYGSTVTKLWQGVASTVFGKGAPALIGVAIHFGVAFFWSLIFLLIVSRWEAIRRRLASWRGVVAVACVYGPLIWMLMSLIVIPLLLRRPPSITFRWWVQLIGHAFFVGLPIVSWFRR